jgi:hypothetical protein
MIARRWQSSTGHVACRRWLGAVQADATEDGEVAVRCRATGVLEMLAVNFHLMGGMPIRAAAPVLPDGSAAGKAPPVANAAQPEPTPQAAAATRSAPGHGPDAPAEVVLRRPIALQMLLTRVRENLV